MWLQPMVFCGFWKDCHKAGKTVVFSTHHMHEVERLCSRILVLHQGGMVYDGDRQKMIESMGKPSLDQAFLALIQAKGILHAA